MRSHPVILAVVVAGGCANSFQSPRVLQPGQTQFTAAIMRSTPDDDFTPDQSQWSGEVQLRRGLGSKLDGGLRYGRAGNAHLLTGDLKFQLVPEKASISIPAGVMFGDDGRDLEYGGLVLTPTLLLGSEVTPNKVEIVGAPKFVLILPDEGDSETEIGLSFGVRLSSDLSRWAIHPEIGWLLVDGAESNLITFGVALSATH